MSEPSISAPTAIAIVGPTAVGKTAVALELAKLLHGAAEIVSVDSMQIYRRMDIGTAKPSPAEQAGSRFVGIDLVDPDADYGVAEFQSYCGREMARIERAGETAILCGGSGLYFRALTTRLDIPGIPADDGLRARWRRFAAVNGSEALHQHLAEIDPDAATRIHVNDVKRQVRALEVYELTGRSISSWHRENREAVEPIADWMPYFCLNADRHRLYATINKRVDAMMTAGWLDEVRQLRELGYGPSLKPMQSLGYKQLNAVIDGILSIDVAVEEIKAQTRHYARRQLIWFRADTRLNWLSVDDKRATEVAVSILASLKHKQQN